MSCLYIIKVGEICLKGGNRKFFEKKLLNNIKRKLPGEAIRLTGRKGRFFLHSEKDIQEKIESALQTTFGVTGYARALECRKDIEAVKSKVQSLLESVKNDWIHFKVESRRADKKFPHTSYEISCLIGDMINTVYSGKNVKMKNPDMVVHVEIRDRAYVYTDSGSGKGPGGLPAGTAGKGYLLLSGGIDSPVAGYLMAKRGLKIDAVYFHTPPYTSDDSKRKVIDLAGTLSHYTNGIRLFIVNFTALQLLVNEKSEKENTTIYTRSLMVSITDRIAKADNAVALVTGEALSQVASQTAETLRVTGSFTDLPVLRPVIGFDKEEIIKIASAIDTYDTSILPYTDCCSLFAPDHPATRPDYEKLRTAIEELDSEKLIRTAVDEAELVIFRADGSRK